MSSLKNLYLGYEEILCLILEALLFCLSHLDLQSIVYMSVESEVGIKIPFFYYMNIQL